MSSRFAPSWPRSGRMLRGRESTRFCRVTSRATASGSWAPSPTIGSSASSTATEAAAASGGTTASPARSALRNRTLARAGTFRVHGAARAGGLSPPRHRRAPARRAPRGIDAHRRLDADRQRTGDRPIGRGWRVIVPYLDFGSGRPFLIMGLDLPDLGGRCRRRRLHARALARLLRSSIR